MTLKGLQTQRCAEALLSPPTLGELRLFCRECIRNGLDLLKKGRTCGRLECERLLSSPEPLLAAVISPSLLRGFFFCRRSRAVAQMPHRVTSRKQGYAWWVLIFCITLSGDYPHYFFRFFFLSGGTGSASFLGNQFLCEVMTSLYFGSAAMFVHS